MFLHISFQLRVKIMLSCILSVSFILRKPTTSLKYEMTQPTFGVVSCA